jgi:hypothetical protein
MLRVIKESAEESQTLVDERTVALTNEFKSSIESSVKLIDQKHDDLGIKIDQLSTDVFAKLQESTDIQRKALDETTESTLGQLTESVQKTSEAINDYAKTISDLEQRQGKTEELSLQVKADVQTHFDALKSIVDERLSQIKDGRDGIDGRDGVAGAAGQDGQDGRDRPIIEPMLVRDGDKVDKNTLVAHGGGLFMTSRKANGSPSDDPAGYNVLVNGIDDISFEQTELRKTAMRVALSDGLVIDHTIENHSPIFRGTFKKEVEYSINDIVIKDRKTLIKVADDGDKQWQMFVFTEKGDQGEAGGIGLTGADGVGIKDIFASDANILFEMTDGRVHTIELALPDLNDDFDGAAVKSFRGYYDGTQTYSSGEIVRMDNSLWLAINRTTDFPSGKSADWVQMIAGSVGGSGGGGDGTPGPTGPRGPMGPPGKNGADGASAYKIAVEQGFVGTEQEWIDSLQGADGAPGPSLVSSDPENAAVISANDGLIYVPKSTSSSVTVSDVPPVDAEENSLWFNTGNGGLYVLYNDGSSIQWVQTTSAPGAATMFASETPPADPTKNQLWFNSSTASMFVYYLDSTGGQWVEIVSIGAAPEITKLQNEIADLKQQVAGLVALIQK